MNGAPKPSWWVRATTVFAGLALLCVSYCAVRITLHQQQQEVELQELRAGVLRLVVQVETKGTAMRSRWMSERGEQKVTTQPLTGETPEQTRARHDEMVAGMQAMAGYKAIGNVEFTEDE